MRRRVRQRPTPFDLDLNLLRLAPCSLIYPDQQQLQRQQLQAARESAAPPTMSRFDPYASNGGSVRLAEAAISQPPSLGSS